MNDDDQKQQQKGDEKDFNGFVEEENEVIDGKVLSFMEDHGINQETAERALKLIDEGYSIEEAIEKA